MREKDTSPCGNHHRGNGNETTKLIQFQLQLRFIPCIFSPFSAGEMLMHSQGCLCMNSRGNLHTPGRFKANYGQQRTSRSRN